MGRFKAFIQHESNEPEVLRIRKSKRVPKTIRGRLVVFTLNDNKFIVKLIPSLNISGYGETESEAESMLKEILGDYFESIIKLRKDKLIRELSRYGWELGPYSRKTFKAIPINKNVILDEFGLPQDTPVKESMLELQVA